MGFDVIRAIETCYAPAADTTAWLTLIREAMAPVAGGAGHALLTYDASDPARFRWGDLTLGGVGKGAQDVLDLFYRMATPELIRALFWTPPPCSSLVKVLRSVAPDASALRRSLLHQLGYQDIIGVNGSGPDHRGVFAGLGAPSHATLPPSLSHRLACLAAHLSTAFRLRRILGTPAVPDSERTEAVLEPSGRVADARGEARAGAVRENLTEGVKRIERARGRARHASPEEAVELWRGLVDGTWSLVDHLETGGKRYVLAVRNPPGVCDPRALTQRERDVLGLAIMGRSNKWIAYALGLSTSTIAEHLHVAGRKLGARSRPELILAWRGVASA